MTSGVSVPMGVTPGKIEEVDAGESDKEAAEEGQGVGDVGGVEALEEDERSTQCCRGEANVVKGVDAETDEYGIFTKLVLNSHVRRERSQSLVEVVHLRQYTHRSENQEHICRRVRKLVIPREGKLEGNAEGLYRHNRD